MRRTGRGSALALGSIALLLAGPAAAQEPEKERRYSVELSAGVGGFAGTVGGETSAGFAYGVRGAYAATPLLSYEVGFKGQSNGIDGTDRDLTSNMIHGGVKVGPQLGEATRWRPYAVAGLGLDFVGAGSEAFGLDNATQIAVPLGIGADVFLGSPIRAGARAAYDVMPGIGGSVAPNDAHPGRWQLSVMAQAAF